MTLVAPEFGHPELSVIMVAHGAWALTQCALAALVAHTERPFEVIVVDNASPDETPARLSERPDLRVILNQENRGFGPATNQGAQHARGERLLLLNTDTFVHPGWLEPLLDTLDESTVGAVVPRFLHLDGSLQEAGVLLARDGTVRFYGDRDDPDRLCYRFRRRVDLGSAACMLLRRNAFDALGGFDSRYAPAYYEDADLCLRLAKQGSAVVYEPRSTVTHVRYGSGRQDTAFELSERNRGLFVQRWASQLEGRPLTFRRASEQAAIAARDAMANPRVLICARPDRSASAEQLARVLLDGWPGARVTWATGAPAMTHFDPGPWLRMGVEVIDQVGASWLDERLFLYDSVVLGEPSDPWLLAALERTQPQAPRIALGELDGAPETLMARLTPALVNAGIAPPSMTAPLVPDAALYPN
jgi:O-antigen biosynthesis protein